MKRLLLLAVFVAFGIQIAEPAFAGRTVVRKGPRRTAVVHKGPHRTTVVVHRNFPLRRVWPAAVVRAPRVAVRVHPRVYLAPVVWTAAIVALPPREVLVWEDGETLHEDDEWVDFTLNADSRGTQLFAEIVKGKAQINFAEVVFENGDTQVVDFNEETRGPGIYSVLDFKDGRKVDHVRVVARARSDEARIVLRMAK